MEVLDIWKEYVEECFEDERTEQAELVVEMTGSSIDNMKTGMPVGENGVADSVQEKFPRKLTKAFQKT